MKELIENRKNLSLGVKAQLAFSALRQNGVVWSFFLLLYYAAAAVAEWAFRKTHDLRKARGLPGMNSSDLNTRIWESWDWSQGGEEWTLSEGWKESLIRSVLVPNMPKGGHILEIGPGAGRWTEHLLGCADRLTGVDISQACVDLCTEKFRSSGKATFLKTDGAGLPGVETGVVDALWSFDVFVHINGAETAGYIREFARVLKPGSRGVIHHGNAAGRKGGWRSDMDGATFSSLLQKEGFRVVQQIEQWQDGNEVFQAGLYDDMITVFEKP